MGLAVFHEENSGTSSLMSRQTCNSGFCCHFWNDLWDIPPKKSFCLTLWPSAVQSALTAPLSASEHQGAVIQSFPALSTGAPTSTSHQEYSMSQLPQLQLRLSLPLVSNCCALAFLSLVSPTTSSFHLLL